MGAVGKFIGKQLFGGALGLGIGAVQNKQEEKRMQKQLELNKQMADYNHQLQLDMFNATGPAAVARQLKEAGLSKSLMYANGSGGGGQLGSGTGEGVSAQNPMAIQMGLQAAQAKANIELTKAQTNKTNEETNQLGGIDKETKQQQLNNMKQVHEQITTTVDNLKKEGKIWQFKADMADMLSNYNIVEKDKDGNEFMTDFMHEWADKMIVKQEGEYNEHLFTRQFRYKMLEFVDDIAEGQKWQAKGEKWNTMMKEFAAKLTENDWKQIDNINNLLKGIGGEGDEGKLIKTIFQGLLLLKTTFSPVKAK